MAPSRRRFLFPDAPCAVGNCTGSCWYGICTTPPPPPSPDSFPIAVHHSSNLLPSFLIASASLLALSCLLLLLFFSLLRLRNRRLLLAQHQHQHQAPPPHAADLLLDAGDGPDDGGPHHAWFIRTVGLDESVIKSIAAAVYKSGDGLIDAGDCSVCLGEFRDGDAIKLLPKCSHAFHIPCIDTWLRSHVTCPLCRSPVFAALAEEAAGSVSGHSEDTQVAVQALPNQEDRAIAIDLTAGSSSSGPPDDADQVQPIRRSVSMDSSSLARLMLRADLESEDKLGEERKGLELREVVISKTGGKGVDCAGKQSAAVEMKRSLSSRSGRFFSRHGWGRTASILPLR